MPQLTGEGRRLVEEIASRHDVSTEAALTVLSALVAGHGSQAQFSHPELGGMGQWSRGGMTMVGDMFNNALKARVDALCTELSALIDRAEHFAAPAQSQSQSQGQPGVSLFVPRSSSAWWPAELGTPASVGSQNDLRYAYFPGSRRLAVELDGRISVFDTGEHRISGVSQQQGADQAITFTSQLGLVRVADLPPVASGLGRPASAGQEPPTKKEDQSTRLSVPPGDRGPRERPEPASAPADDIFAKIERLAELRRKDIITEEEYVSKKAELLARL